MCEFCGAGADEHTDEWGRHVPCLESIGGTILAHAQIEGTW